MKKLYGDGIHDDYPYIQAQLDSGVCEVFLPAPKVNYVISKTLQIHSNQTLKLPRMAIIKLAKMSNCAMVENVDFEKWETNICLDGGIWDMNHNNQWPNPYHFPDSNGVIRTKAYMKEKFGWTPQSGLVRPTYTGHAFVFSRVKNFTFKNVTIVNPVVYGVQLSFIEYFTIENIRVRVIIYFISKQLYTSCLPVLLCDVTIPGEKPMAVKSGFQVTSEG